MKSFIATTFSMTTSKVVTTNTGQDFHCTTMMEGVTSNLSENTLKHMKCPAMPSPGSKQQRQLLTVVQLPYLNASKLFSSHTIISRSE